MAYYRPKSPEETYKFAQCFGEKNDSVEVNDGTPYRKFCRKLILIVWRE